MVIKTHALYGVKKPPTVWRTLATGLFLVGCPKVGTRSALSGSAAKALTHRSPHCRTDAEVLFALTSGFRGDPSTLDKLHAFCCGLKLPVQRRGARLTLFPALRLPEVGADLLRGRAGQLRDAPGQGQREWREPRGGTGVENGLGRGALLGVRIYFGTGSVSARKRDARRSQCGTGAPPPSVSRLHPLNKRNGIL